VDRGGGAYEVKRRRSRARDRRRRHGGTAHSSRVYVTDAAAGGSGMVAIDYVQVSDGAGDPVPVEAGPAASVTIDRTGPPALTDLDAQPVAGGGDRDAPSGPRSVSRRRPTAAAWRSTARRTAAIRIIGRGAAAAGEP